MTSPAVGRVPCRQTRIRSPGQTQGSRILTLLLVSHGSGRAAPPHSAAAATSSHHTCTSRRGCTHRVIAADTTVLLLLWPPMVSLPPPALQLLYRLRPSTVSLPPLVHHLVVHLWPSTVSLPPLVHQLVVPSCISGRPRCPCHHWYTSLLSLFCSVLFLVTPPTLHTIRSGRAVEPLSRRTPW